MVAKKKAVNTRSRAYRDGYKDGLAWDLDGYESREDIGRAFGWDESTINAIGIGPCELAWGVRHDDGSAAWDRACAEYNVGCQSGAMAPQSRRSGNAPRSRQS